ncbi:MAG: hypothetical protein PHY96_02660 [Candidatus Pacebacteria bacterium]|nr:hypothetical protein [Candidatus Paceibacterota bacterium]
MRKLLKRRRFFNVATLFFLTVLLVFPNISLAEDFDDITLRETAKYLELPGDRVHELINSFISVFHSEWTKLMIDPASSAEKTAVPIIMKRVVQIQVLNHLLVDAPIKTTFMIIQGATKAARVLLLQDYSHILNELEKESVNKAVDYGMSVLLENEMRMSPGAIEFEYEPRQGGKEKALIQYVIVYRLSDTKNGEIIVRFYSPDSLKPPKNKGSYWGALVMYTELEDDLPPFIVDVRGNVENCKWVGQPTIEIDFPPEVPDLDIRPLSFWERLVLKPFEATIKDVEVIITKITGQKVGLIDTWDTIKSFVSGIANFSPAAIFSSSEEKNIEQATIVEESVFSVPELDSAPIPLSILSDFDITPPPPPPPPPPRQ